MMYSGGYLLVVQNPNHSPELQFFKARLVGTFGVINKYYMASWAHTEMLEADRAFSNTFARLGEKLCIPELSCPCLCFNSSLSSLNIDATMRRQKGLFDPVQPKLEAELKTIDGQLLSRFTWQQYQALAHHFFKPLASLVLDTPEGYGLQFIMVMESSETPVLTQQQLSTSLQYVQSIKPIPVTDYALHSYAASQNKPTSAIPSNTWINAEGSYESIPEMDDGYLEETLRMVWNALASLCLPEAVIKPERGFSANKYYTPAYFYWVLFYLKTEAENRAALTTHSIVYQICHSRWDQLEKAISGAREQLRFK